MDTVKEMMDKLAISSNPNDWLLSFAYRCEETQQGRMKQTQLFAALVMMGPEEQRPYDLCDKMPEGYNEMISASLKQFGLLGRMKRCLRDDARKSEDVCICSKWYVPILKSFLNRA